MAEVVPLASVPTKSIEQLLDAAFGSDRHQRTAYKLREASVPLAALSFALRDGDAIIASIQCWPVRIGNCPLILVGPVAVDPDHQNSGHGSHLMRTLLKAAAALGDPAMVMIGDPEYYHRFGFTADQTAGWTMPGPWEPRRLLARNPVGHALPQTGILERADAL